ncbi:hypothetical protein HAX54_052010, partial [Datura stramonium]|nr:hypothetical protein [Datura stramonium]
QPSSGSAATLYLPLLRSSPTSELTPVKRTPSATDPRLSSSSILFRRRPPLPKVWSISFHHG